MVRALIVATVGLTLLLGAAPTLKEENQTEPLNAAREVDNRAAATRSDGPQISRKVEAAEPVQPSEISQYCEQEQDNRRSDLCAQWKAADSAYNAAKWAMWSFILGLVGTLGLFFTLYWTRKAVHVAMDATKDADTAIAIAERSAEAAAAQVRVVQETAKHELRAYVGVKSVGLSEIITGPYGTAKPRQDSVYLTLKNYGKTPAVVAFAADAQLGGEQPRPASVAKPGGAPQILQPGRSIFRAFPVKEIEGDARRFFVILRIFYTDIYGVGYGHRLDYSSKKPGQRALQCTHEEETIHPPAPKEAQTDE